MLNIRPGKPLFLPQCESAGLNMNNLVATFRELHAGAQPLCLANAWDAGSARLIESLGAPAIATTSAWVAWALGYPDGNVLPIHSLAVLAANIVRLIRVPLSVDFEAGFSDLPAVAAENIKLLLDAGVAGINLEDGKDSPDLLLAKLDQIKRCAIAHGTDLFVNVRTDVYLQGLVSEDKRLEEAVARGRRYRSAGADGFFVPALTMPSQIRTIVEEVDLPLNVMAWPGQSPADALGKLGVRRLSAGSALPQVLWANAEVLARDFLTLGRSESLYKTYKPHQELQALFTDR
jgi:2-methylisocitrate lyase-like PEP mutase family enzyme